MLTQFDLCLHFLFNARLLYTSLLKKDDSNIVISDTDIDIFQLQYNLNMLRVFFVKEVLQSNFLITQRSPRTPVTFEDFFFYFCIQNLFNFGQADFPGPLRYLIRLNTIFTNYAINIRHWILRQLAATLLYLGFIYNYICTCKLLSHKLQLFISSILWHQDSNCAVL